MVGMADVCTEMEPTARSSPVAGGGSGAWEEHSPAPRSPVAGWPSLPSSPALILHQGCPGAEVLAALGARPGPAAEEVGSSCCIPRNWPGLGDSVECLRRENCWVI